MTSKERKIVIDNPQLQSRGQRVVFGGITLFFWMLWVYIWLPLVSLAAWGFGIQLFYKEMIVNDGLAGLLATASIYAVTVIFLALLLGAWAVYNYARFHGKTRRSSAPPVSTQQMAQFFGVDEPSLTVWQEQRHLVVHFGDGAQVRQVDCPAREDAAAPEAAPSPQTADARPEEVS